MSKKSLYEFEGEMLSVKTIAGRVKLSHTTIYKYLKEGYTIVEAVELGKMQSSKAFKNRKKTNNRQAKTYPYKDNLAMTVEEISTLEGISKDNLYRRLKSGMTPEEAVAEIKKNTAPKFPYLNNYYSKWQLERITGATRWYLDKNILDDKEYTEEEITAIIDSYKQQYVCKYKGVSLYQYCIQMGYNYNVVYYGMKAYNLTPEEAINQYLDSGQLARFRHKYVLGDVLLYHFLLKMNLEDRYVMARIRRGRTEEEAIVDAIFFNRETYRNRAVRNSLRAIYDEIESIEDIKEISAIYGLTPEDIKFLNAKAYRAAEVLTQYRLFSALTLMQAAESTENLEEILKESGISVEDIDSVQDELLEGFVKRIRNDNNDEVKYIWRKEN